MGVRAEPGMRIRPLSNARPEDSNPEADTCLGSWGVARCRGPPDPVALLEGQNHTREPDLVPAAARPDDDLAVHLLPGRGQDHGRGLEGHPRLPVWARSCAAMPTG